MALLLCHQCYSWVEPIGEQCPQCDYPLDARQPDPSAEQLGLAIGRIMGRIGEVRLMRTALPDRGSLYETAHGLFFIPDQLEQVTVVAGERPSGRGRAAAAVWSWLQSRLFRAWRAASNRRNSGRLEIAVAHQGALGPLESDHLPHLLMANPGVLFLPRRSIHRIQRGFRGWTISRPNRLAIKLKPLGNREEFHARLSAFAGTIRESVCR